MNAAKAKKIIKNHLCIDGNNYCSIKSHEIFNVAEGYLEALKGPEVKALVEIIEALKHIVTDEEMLEINIVLIQYYKAVRK